MDPSPSDTGGEPALAPTAEEEDEEKEEDGCDSDATVCDADMLASGLEARADGTYFCRPCGVGPFTSMKMARPHIQGRQHKKRCCRLAAEFIGPEEIENLPGYVDVNVIHHGELVCLLCQSRATTLDVMQRHLGSDRHSRACVRTGYPRLEFSEERKRLEIKGTGRPVSRTNDAAAGVLEAPAAKRKSRKKTRARSVSAAPMRSDQHADDGNGAASSRHQTQREALVPGQLVLVKQQPTAPIEWATTNFLLPLEIGQPLSVRYVDGDYFWGVTLDSSRAGWVSNVVVAQQRSQADGTSSHIVNGRSSTAEASTVASNTTSACATLQATPDSRSTAKKDSTRSKSWSAGRGHGGSAAQGDMRGRGLTEDLPPGWTKLSGQQGGFFYADLETGWTQWDPPPAENERWTREVDRVIGRAIWRRLDSNMQPTGHAFDEAQHADMGWVRRKGWDERHYWVNHNLGIRFYEPGRGNNANRGHNASRGHDVSRGHNVIAALRPR